MSLSAMQAMCGGGGGGGIGGRYGSLGLEAGMDPDAPYAGTTPTVYPGRIGIGQADPAAEERFNEWMDGFLGLSESRQRGELSKLDASEKAGTLTPDEVRRLKFMRNFLGVTVIPEVPAGELARAPTEQIEEQTIVGKKRSGLPMFLGLMALGAVAIVGASKSKGG